MQSVIVLGLGAWGSAVAWQCAAAGMRVVGFDRFHPPHSRGSTHGQSRAFRRRSTDPTEAQLLLWSEELYLRLRSESREDLFRPVEGLWVFDDDRTLRDTVFSYESTGTPYEVLDATELTLRCPDLSISSHETALIEPSAAVIHPELTVRAQLELARRAGASLHFGEAVQQWRVTDSGVTVLTAAREHTADWLIICAGPWSPSLLNFDSGSYAERQVFVEIPTPSGRSAYELPVAAFPTAGKQVALYFHPQPDSLKVALHHGGARVEADNAIQEATDFDISQIRHELRRRAPVWDAAPRAAYTCLYTNTSDGDFMVGAHPVHPEVLIMTGCNGGGMRVAPGMGRLAVEFVDGSSSLDLGAWDPSRGLTPL